MTTDILSIVPYPDSMKPQALEYLRKSISQQTAEGVSSYVKKQSQLFNEHAHHLAEILRVVDNAPPGINLNLFLDGYKEGRMVSRQAASVTSGDGIDFAQGLLAQIAATALQSRRSSKPLRWRRLISLEG